MKKIYIETSISYIDNSGGNSRNGEEFFVIRLRAENKLAAGGAAIKKSLSQFDKKINHNFNDIHCQVETIYECDDD